MFINALLLVLLKPVLGAAAAVINAEITDGLRVDASDHFKRSEEADFTPGFLVPANISLENYDDFKELMVPVTSLSDSDWDLPIPPLDTHFANDDDTRVSISERQNDRTKVLVGQTQVDYGCEASIRLPLLEAINSLCSGGLCNAERTYTRQVQHIDRSPRRDATLSINIEGDYDGRHTRGYISNLVENLVTPKTAHPAWREYFQQIGQHTRHHACSMSKFSNYIAINKDFGDDKVNIQIRIRLQTTNSRQKHLPRTEFDIDSDIDYCISTADFFEALFSMSGHALAFFKNFEASCA